MIPFREAVSCLKQADVSEAVPLNEVGYKATVAIMAQNYERAVKQAIQLRRNGVVDNRAEAIEMAFDLLIKKATNDTWIRIGEVAIAPNARGVKTVRALCKERGSEIGSTKRKVPIGGN